MGALVPGRRVEATGRSPLPLSALLTVMAPSPGSQANGDMRVSSRLRFKVLG